MTLDELLPILEAILFASEEPVTIARLVAVLPQVNEEELENALQHLKERYEDTAFGFELRSVRGGFHFVSKAIHAEFVRKFLAARPFKLGRSSLEVLSIIAYKQPVTRAEIDQIRGIDSSHLLRTLMDRGIVKMAGKADVPGRPVQYATTPKFLDTVGLNTLADLPPLTELEQIRGSVDEPIAELTMGLDRIMGETDSAPIRRPVDDVADLSQLDQMIKSTQTSVSAEVYASPLHKEVGETNQQSVQASEWLSHQRRKRKIVPEREDELPQVSLEEPAVVENSKIPTA